MLTTLVALSLSLSFIVLIILIVLAVFLTISYKRLKTEQKELNRLYTTLGEDTLTFMRGANAQSAAFKKVLQVLEQQDAEQMEVLARLAEVANEHTLLLTPQKDLISA